jgi:hypothetical protein
MEGDSYYDLTEARLGDQITDDKRVAITHGVKVEDYHQY